MAKLGFNQKSRRMQQAQLDLLGDSLDQLATIDLLGHGLVGPLYRAARQVAGEPLSTLAARRLVAAVTPGSTVLLVTGFPVRPWVSPGIGESDGPPGAAALAWTLAQTLRCAPVVVTSEPLLGQAMGACTAVGMRMLTLQQARQAATGPRPLIAGSGWAFPAGPHGADAAAQAIFAATRPAAIVFVEHPGANAAGVYHNARGQDVSAATAHTAALLALAAQHGILTISMVDNINEVGSHAVSAALPAALAARPCTCPCGGSVAAADTSSVVVVGSCANWAAYATARAVSVMTGHAHLRFSRAQDARAVEAVMAGGGIDTVTGTGDPDAGIDGMPTTLSGHIVELLGSCRAADVAPLATQQGQP